MEYKIQLFHEPSLYYLLVFDEYSKDSQDHEPHLKVCFPYKPEKPETKKETLEKARNFAKNFKKDGLTFKFEEKL
jgi:hypothetical protein